MFLVSIVFACAVLILAGRFFWAIWVAYQNGELAGRGVEHAARSVRGRANIKEQLPDPMVNLTSALPMAAGKHFDIAGNANGTVAHTFVDPDEMC